MVPLENAKALQALYLREIELGQKITAGQPRHLMPLLDWGRHTRACPRRGQYLRDGGD
jgi:hypothetical protein